MRLTCSLPLLTFFALAKGQDDNVVEIEGGKIRGMAMEDYRGGEFLAFLSVPFAKPPLGPLRFKLAQPVDPWDGILDATEDLPKCYQVPYGLAFGQEDCLYLNVYTRDLKARDLRPVMVYIHEGAFSFGSGSVEDVGPQHLMIEDIVFVAADYRLGALGFLSLDGSDIPENIGLKDQVFALKWVQRNIAKFGGDPNLVTIFGESAGAVSVGLHMLSPLSKGLFHRAISQSGNALSNWIMGSKNTGLLVAKELGIESQDPKNITEELRKFHYTEIFEAQSKLNWVPVSNIRWNGGVVVEGPGEDSFLPDDPLTLLRNESVDRVPYLIGYNDAEGIIREILVKVCDVPYNLSILNDVPYDLSHGDWDKIQNLEERFKDFYFHGGQPQDYDDDFIRFLTDVSFLYPLIRVIRNFGKQQPLYVYEFSADTSLNLYKHIHPDIAKRHGASHADDTGYLFQSTFNPYVEQGSVEDVLVERMVKLWTNFARHGDPLQGLPLDDFENVRWMPATPEEMNYLKINITVQEAVFENPDFIVFWDKVYEDFTGNL